MKVKIGGTTEFNIIPVQYESVKISATFEIEEDVSDLQEFTEEYSDKVQEKIEEQLKKHTQASIKKYGEAKKNHKRILENLD